MDNFTLFICGIVVTLIAGMGVITSEVFLGYYKYLEKERMRQLQKAQEQDGTSNKLCNAYVPFNHAV